MGVNEHRAENFAVETRPSEAPGSVSGTSGQLADRPVLLLGMGNILLTDDGVGIHVLRALEPDLATGGASCRVRLCDGGTLGLELLTALEGAKSLVVIDATRFGASPGTVRVFVDGEMDKQLRGGRRSVHEVALADLMAAAQLIGRAPARRALVGIQPESLQWGTEPTLAVHAAIPHACSAVRQVLTDWGESNASG